MIKSDIGENAGVIWNLLSERGILSIRQIGEITGFRSLVISLALGWLAKENQIRFIDKNSIIHIELNQPVSHIYY